MNKKLRKNIMKILIIFIIIIFSYSMSVFGRYVYNSIKDMYLTSKSFYFESDTLRLSTPTYTYADWNGQDIYAINVELYSYKNSLLTLDYDLNYTISCDTDDDDKIICYISKSADEVANSRDGIIYAENNIANEKIYIVNKPGVVLNTNDSVTVNVTATAKGEFEKTIKAKFIITISDKDSNIKVIDSITTKYATLLLTNPGKTSSEVTVEFDPNLVRLDSSNAIYKENISNEDAFETVKIDGIDYISKITFSLQPESTIDIKFYKVPIYDEENSKYTIFDYSYPKDGAECIFEIWRK